MALLTASTTARSGTRQRFPAGSWKKKTIKKDKEPYATGRGSRQSEDEEQEERRRRTRSGDRKRERERERERERWDGIEGTGS